MLDPRHPIKHLIGFLIQGGQKHSYRVKPPPRTSLGLYNKLCLV